MFKQVSTVSNLVARASSRTLASSVAPAAARGVHTLPELPYAYDALEPHICKEIMELHHKKHHNTYVTGLNTAEENLKQLKSQPETPETVKKAIALQPALKFNGGGHINHSLFWKNLAPPGESKLVEGGKLIELIERDFGSMENLKKEMNTKTAAIQGSGWGWLVLNKNTAKLEVITTANQDPVLAPYVPIIGIDIWEHAFYIQYKNVKPDYLNAIWNVINFNEAENRINAAL